MVSNEVAPGLQYVSAVWIWVAVYAHKLDKVSPVLGRSAGWISPGTLILSAFFRALVGPLRVLVRYI